MYLGFIWLNKNTTQTISPTSFYLTKIYELAYFSEI